MESVFQAALRSWEIPPAASFALTLTALVYLRGWWLLRRAGLPYLPTWRAFSFLLGLLSLWVALASPLDTFSGFVLTAHMLQHMLLMMVAPPLILLGAPLIPIVRGLPIFAAREFAGPFLNWSFANRVGRTLTNPVCAILLMGGVMFAWHTPALYELALASASWHEVEHASFFITSIIFWWPVVQPWPSRAQWPRWAMVPYLLVADLQNTALSAILVFSDRVLYPSYAAIPRLFGFSAQEDQVAAGAIMWVVGSLAFIVPAIVIAVQCLSRKSSQTESISARKREPSSPDALLLVPQRIPFLSSFVQRKWRSKAIEAAFFVMLFLVTGLCFAGLLSSRSSDDDQVVRLRATTGPFAVSVFAPPGNLAGGPTTFSVLVQDRNTGETVQDATVDFTVHPGADSQGPSSAARATHEQSEIKLMQAAEVNLPSDGEWTLNISLQRNSEHADLSLPLHVVKGEAGIEFRCPYLAILVFAAILALVYLRRHHAPKSVGLERTVSSLCAIAENTIVKAVERPSLSTTGSIVNVGVLVALAIEARDRMEVEELPEEQDGE